MCATFALTAVRGLPHEKVNTLLAGSRPHAESTGAHLSAHKRLILLDIESLAA